MKQFIKCICFALVTIGIVLLVSRMLVPEYFIDSEWPTTTTYRGFYEMEENTCDVLFLGSSSGASSFIPQELYNEYGIRSYNLSCEQQNMMTSYYWLKEALRYQTPKVVVLESRYAFVDDGFPEPFERKAFDSMKLSKVKMEAINTICSLDDTQDALSYYFPIIRFHSRWSDLSYKDGWSYYMNNIDMTELKGYCPFNEKVDYYANNFEIGTTGECMDMVPIEVEFMDKIVDLCNQNGIAMIFVHTPTSDNSTEMFNALNVYTYERGIRLIDFNEIGINSDIQYDFINDNADGAHPNIWGAIKLTKYIGRVLSSDYGMTAVEDSQWNNTNYAYANLITDYSLSSVNSVDEYLELLANNKDRYTIFVSVRDEATSSLKDSTISMFQELGLKAELKDQTRCGYLAVLSEDKFVEKIGYELLEDSDSLNSWLTYSIKSAGFDNGNVSSIIINENEFSKEGRGFNIVVYNNETNSVIDSVNFDTCAGNDCFR